MSTEPTGDFFTEWRNHDEAKYRLSQAAPDLLAALVAADDLIAWLGTPMGYSPADFEPARAKRAAAIARATGYRM